MKAKNYKVIEKKSKINSKNVTKSGAITCLSFADDVLIVVVVKVGPHSPKRVRAALPSVAQWFHKFIVFAVHVVDTWYIPSRPSPAEPLDLVGDDSASQHFLQSVVK